MAAGTNKESVAPTDLSKITTGHGNRMGKDNSMIDSEITPSSSRAMPLPPFGRRALADPRNGHSVFVYIGHDAMGLAAHDNRLGPLLAIPDDEDPARFCWTPIVQGRDCVIVAYGRVGVERIERAAQAMLAGGCELVVTTSRERASVCTYRRY